MDGQLEIIDGPDKGRTVPFRNGQTLVIGRGPTTDTKLTDRYSSRVHCQLEIRDGLLTLTDMGSASGTVVNDAKIDGKQVLFPGDVIAVGTTKLQVQISNPAEDKTVHLPTPAPTSAQTPTLPVLPEDASQMEGLSLAGYKLGKILGKGSTGVIYRACKPPDPSAVAFKVFYATFSNDADARRRFLRGAQTVLTLRHPNLVSVLDAGEVGHFCWMAMELVEGESLAKVIQRIGIANILDWRYGLRVAIHIARGLEFAQKHAVVHRNITPSNILIRSSDNAAKLGDLILVKALEGPDAQAITTPGQLLGNIAYMSPERALGGPAVDGRSDLYELGATVYAVLTGRPPCEGKSITEIANALQTVPPISPRKVQLSIPVGFEAVILRLLAKKPAERFPTPSELLAALEQIARDERVVT